MALTKITSTNIGANAVTTSALNLTTLSAGNTVITGTASVSTTLSAGNTTITGTTYANGSLGVGTSSPQNTVEVYNGSNTQIRVRNGGVNAQSYDFGRNGDTGLLGFYGNQTGYTGYTFGGIDGTRMTIDSAGRVTKPYQPYCLVGRNGGNVNAQTVPIPWNQVVYNIGGHFNASTYRFTAPIAGYYYASINAMAIGGNPLEVAIRINGSTAINTRNGGGASNYNSTSATHILYLAANDYIDAKVEGGYAMSGGDGYAYSGMSCYLLG